MIEIEKDVPMPKTSLAGRPMLYPFPEMEVGDSFRVECKEKDRTLASSRVRVAAQSFARRVDPSQRFSVIQVFKDGVFVEVRCWRVK